MQAKMPIHWWVEFPDPHRNLTACISEFNYIGLGCLIEIANTGYWQRKRLYKRDRYGNENAIIYRIWNSEPLLVSRCSRF